MSRKAIPKRDAWPEMSNEAFRFLQDLQNTVESMDVETLSDIDASSTAAEIGAAIAAFYASAK